MNLYGLVADIGGTNARLALCNLKDGAIDQIKTYSAKQYAGLESIISHYLAEQKVIITYACIAIACPINGDWVEMTNHQWAFSISELKQALGLEKLDVINDFTAVSMAIPMLTEEHKVQLGGGAAVEDKPIAVYGAGTGLGVAHLIKAGKQWISLPGEGGHVDFAANSEEQDAILAVLRRKLGHVSVERILSGSGLVNLYQAIAILDQSQPEDLEPEIVTQRALDESCQYCHRALALFCEIMGRFGGNLALNMGAFGGVYIAGGIVPRFFDFFKQSNFLYGFEDKGRFKTLVQQIPVYLITHPQPGLLGSGTYLRQKLSLID
ncbi:glucokinase [Photorhabdus temperata]|uniref:Glucokinase n=1 Tax=Photorhabdus temperata subsp. temperata Meg1 TaxID=1393735 RepID=A0A081RYU1_PHOTE|nr:glucokinase [Photorhabdus temperata]KER03844.1 glucokinase [Photorhabdus temperata subsp. temperata Meg1]MCT8349043.1 glucokinase [Photorhabdus temperata]